MLERALERAVTRAHVAAVHAARTRGRRQVAAGAGVPRGPAASATVLRGRCLSYGEGITFYPLAEVVQEAAGIADGRLGDGAARSSPRSSRTPRTRDRIAPLVAGLVGWGEPVATEEAFWGVRKLFEHLARDRRSSSCSTTSTGPSRRSST